MPEQKKSMAPLVPSISVIIPVCDHAVMLPVLLDQMAKQKPAIQEIILLDSCKNDDLKKGVADRQVRIIAVPPDSYDHGGTRAMGVREARGEIVVFFTQDVALFSENTVAELVRPLLENRKVAASFGRQLPGPDAGFFATRLRLHNYPERSRVLFFKDRAQYGIKTAFCSNSFAAFHKGILLALGNFKDGLIFGEDMHMAARLLLAGYGIAYRSGASVAHSHNYSVMEDFRRYFDMGVFHKSESWLVEKFGTAEKEGISYLMQEIKALFTGGHMQYLPQWCVRNGMKFLGYFLGKRYARLPNAFSVWCSMNRRWWQRRRFDT